MSEVQLTVSFHTLGCRVNQYESDAVSAELKRAGVTIVPFGEPCRIAVINTCTVTAESDRKSRQMIRRAAKSAEMVVVAGCYGQIDPVGAASMEKVVYVGGNSGKASLAETILQLLHGTYRGEVDAVAPHDQRGAVEMTLDTPMRTRSYVKIEDGCGNRCSYCLISQARGPVRSKEPALVLEEVRRLAEAGAQEVILTGIETASYGMDFPGHLPYGHALADLIEQVAQIDGIRRIGLGSLDPTVMSEYFCRKIAAIPEVLPHFHLSVQSGSSKILAAMRRKYNRDMLLTAVERMRAARSDVTFSADVIVGFPGETEEEFLETLTFCESVRFLHLHIFPYSRRTGTEAASLPNQVPEEEKRRRLVRLEESAREMKRQILEDYVTQHRGTPIWMLTEKTRGCAASGHSEHFIEVRANPARSSVGEILPVVLTSSDGDFCYGHRQID